VITWYKSIPSSSSHALVGGVLGSVLVAEGSSGVLWGGLGSKVAAPGLVAPFVCGAAAIVATRVALRLTRSRRADSTATGFRLSQVLSSSLVALAHGTNDAQKTMGVIVLTLVAGDRLAPGAGVPNWVKVSCAVAVALGTFSGGWRVIRTLGTQVTTVEPAQGFSAETASATTILASTFFGFSLSTTQVVSGGVVGTGVARTGEVVHWSVVRRMVGAWVLTVPAADWSARSLRRPSVRSQAPLLASSSSRRSPPASSPSCLCWLGAPTSRPIMSSMGSPQRP
jgi:PiT family inorganic phosphate transporter